MRVHYLRLIINQIYMFYIIFIRYTQMNVYCLGAPYRKITIICDIISENACIKRKYQEIQILTITSITVTPISGWYQKRSALTNYNLKTIKSETVIYVTKHCAHFFVDYIRRPSTYFINFLTLSQFNNGFILYYRVEATMMIFPLSK